MVGYRSSALAATRRIDDCEARSAGSVSATAASPAAARIRRAASSAFVSLRAIMTSCAPQRASAVAAANPMPLVAPVIRTRLPATPFHGCIRGHPTMLIEEVRHGNRNRPADVAEGNDAGLPSRLGATR